MNLFFKRADVDKDKLVSEDEYVYRMRRDYIDREDFESYKVDWYALS
jgi:hypothetical protein